MTEQDPPAVTTPSPKRTAAQRHQRLDKLARRWRDTCRVHQRNIDRAEKRGDHETAADIRARLKRAQTLARRAEHKSAKYQSIASLDPMAAKVVGRAEARRLERDRRGKRKPRKPKPERRATHETTVDSPYEPGKIASFDTIQRVVDPITALHRRRHIDDFQARAAGRVRDAHELIGAGLSGTLDPSRGGGGGSAGKSLSTEKLWAAHTLTSIRTKLSADDVELLLYIAGEGHSIAEAARRCYGKMSNRSCDLVSDRLKRSLKTLAQFWGMYTRRKTPTFQSADRSEFSTETASEIAPSRVAHASKLDVKYSGEDA